MLEPKIGFNYLGQFDNGGETKGWSITDELVICARDSRNHHPNLLDINGWIINGVLKVSFGLFLNIHQQL